MIETVDDIKTIANVGTGTMGHAITLQFALAGYPVHLVGRGEASLEKAMKAIRSDAEDFAEAGLLKDGDTLDAVLARITGYADYASGVADVDFVIESVAENLDIKKSVWAEVEHAAPKDAILSTNTSGLSPTALQSVLKKPERFVVAHFWNPAQLMPLVEVVPVRRPIRRWWTSPSTSWPRSARSRRRSRRNRWALWATACNWPCCARRSTSSSRASRTRPPWTT